MSQIPDMPSMISAARSRNMRYYLVAQSLHRLCGKYGEDADTSKGNCDNWVFLTSKELDLLNEISELCGYIVTADIGLTQEELADKIGVSRSTILSIENKKQEMTWNIFLSLILLFTKNETTNKLLNVLEIYTDEFHDFIQDR